MTLGRLSFPSMMRFFRLFSEVHPWKHWYPGIPVFGIPSHLTLLCGTRVCWGIWYHDNRFILCRSWRSTNLQICLGGFLNMSRQRGETPDMLLTYREDGSHLRTSIDQWPVPQISSWSFWTQATPSYCNPRIQASSESSCRGHLFTRLMEA